VGNDCYSRATLVDTSQAGQLDNKPDPTNPDSPDNTEDLARLASTDRNDGFAQLYSRVAPSLYAWAALKIRPHRVHELDPEDIVQDVWLRAMDRFASFDPEKGNFRTWILTIATNSMINAFRRLELRRTKGDGQVFGESHFDGLPADATNISQRVARDEQLKNLIDHVNQLDDTDRELFVNFGLEGMTARQVAELTGSTPDAAAKRWQRLRQRLRESVEVDAWLA
jgi:RNA polymerase sigma-70 factor (ECF subfamily)